MITTVAVMVNPTAEELARVIDFVDVIQLHGDEPPELCAAIAKRVIKAFRVGDGFDPKEVLNYNVAGLLVDAAIPSEWGGTGAICDWDLARSIVAIGKPVILAGGLTPENVASAIETVGPYGVDTAGGVEQSPGKKDHERIRDFVRNAQQQLSR